MGSVLGWFEFCGDLSKLSRDGYSEKWPTEADKRYKNQIDSTEQRS